MLVIEDGKKYSVPNLPQVADYRYAKDLDCSCGLCVAGWEEKIKKWHCDGVYDCNAGLMICFTCKVCGDKIFYHIRDNANDYAAIGVFDEYEVKE